jgi:hypothetical protein
MASIKKWLTARQRVSSDTDLPFSHLNLFQYADDIALIHIKQKKFEACEIHLEEDLKTLSRFFHQWHLRPNPSKTEICVFHLETHDANRKLTLDRTLSYKPHLEKLE